MDGDEVGVSQRWPPLTVTLPLLFRLLEEMLPDERGEVGVAASWLDLTRLTLTFDLKVVGVDEFSLFLSADQRFGLRSGVVVTCFALKKIENLRDFLEK